jgi:U6 snRNA-associated Sm-like protein LSm8
VIYLTFVRISPIDTTLTEITEKVLVLTADGRTLTGILLSCDQLTNLVLNNTIERIIRDTDDDEASQEVGHGLYLIRGENVSVCGLVDEELDSTIDWTKVRGSIIGVVKHS